MLTHYNIIFNFNGIDIFIFLLKNYIKVEAFWLPLQPWFAKDTAFFSAKAQKLQKAALLKKRQKSALKKQENFKGEAFWLPLQPWFAKDTAFFSAKAQNSGIRLSRIPGIICRFPSWSVFAPLGAGGLCPALAWGFW